MHQLIRKRPHHLIKSTRLPIKNADLFSSEAYIRTFPDILEHSADILEVLDLLLENPDHLFEHRQLILEDCSFIRTFQRLLEHCTNLLENRRAIALELSNGTIKNTIC